MFEMLTFGIALLVVYVISGTYFTPMIAALLTAFVFGAGALVAALKSRKPRAKELGLKAGAFVLFAALILGCGRLNNIHARHGAVKISNACEAYKAKTGAYPAALRQIVPEYIADIPAAKLTVTWNQYRLVAGKVMFVLEPGLLAESYDLAAKKWQVAEVADMFPREAL